MLTETIKLFYHAKIYNAGALCQLRSGMVLNRLFTVENVHPGSFLCHFAIIIIFQAAHCLYITQG